MFFGEIRTCCQSWYPQLEALQNLSGSQAATTSCPALLYSHNINCRFHITLTTQQERRTAFLS